MSHDDAPLAIDLFCGLGGWTEGLLSEGYEVIGFDIERHIYGEHRYPAQLVIQDVRTLHGSQFRHADLIVASSPCQEFSYRAMPWKRAKALGPPHLGMELFAQAARIQREASEAAGRHIPMVQENVRGAQKWVGKAAWHYGSFFLWGDVPALMPMTKGAVKVPTMGAGYTHAERGRRTDPGNGARFTSRDCGVEARHDGVKGVGIGSRSWAAGNLAPNDPRLSWSKSSTRKAASAAIAKIPFPLASFIARTWKPSVVA